jgi:hypothetical protein
LTSPDSRAEDKAYGVDWEELVDLLDALLNSSQKIPYTSLAQTREVDVKAGDGSDFVDVWNAYAGERVIKVPQGRFKITESLPVYEGAVLKGAGRFYDSQGTSTLDSDPVVGTVLQLDFDGNLFNATGGTKRGCVFEDFFVYRKRESGAYQKPAERRTPEEQRVERNW